LKSVRSVPSVTIRRVYVVPQQGTKARPSQPWESWRHLVSQRRHFCDGSRISPRPLWPNAPVHRAAVNNSDFRTSATRGSRANGLLSGVRARRSNERPEPAVRHPLRIKTGIR
jgi:hypothetical protein